MLAAKGCHPRLGPAIDQRILHLVGNNRDAVAGDDAQPLGIEIGQREMPDLSLALQIGEMPQRIEVALIRIIPPMELEEIEAIHTHPRQRHPDRPLDDRPGHPSGMRHPFCKRLALEQPLAPTMRGEAPPELADEILGGAVMVGQIPGG